MTIFCDFHCSKKNFFLNFKKVLSGQDITAITGPSGSGKTTILRLMAGLEKAEHSTFIVNNRILQKDDVFVPTEKRDITYVGQETRLFPFLNVYENIKFAQKRASKNLKKPPSLNELIEVFDVKKCLVQTPQELSTGEQQRVALIQAIINNPDLFLFDEAFSAIDEARKKIMIRYILNQLKHTPIIYVSHDENELSIVNPKQTIKMEDSK